jgi:hypothetical protein
MSLHFRIDTLLILSDQFSFFRVVAGCLYHIGDLESYGQAAVKTISESG